MDPLKIFRDEADLQVSDTSEKVENEDTTETPEDESPEDDNKPAEDTEETVTDDSEDKSDDSEDEESDEEDDQYTDSEEEYIQQFDLPDNVKTQDDAIKYLIENQGKTANDTKLSQVDEYLKGRGMSGGVDELLALDTVAKAPAQPTSEKIDYVSATENLNKNITSGLVNEDEARLLRPMAENYDATAQILGDGLQAIWDELQTIKQGSQQMALKQGDTDYRAFVKESKKNGIRPLAKTELDKVMKTLPGSPDYLKAQTWLLMSDPTKLKNQLNMMRQKVEKNAFKKLRKRGGKYLKGKGRADKRSGKSFKDYTVDGKASKEFYKLPSEEQDRLLDQVISNAK